MDTLTHTPGPWVVRPYNSDTVRNGTMIVGGGMMLTHSIWGRTLEQADANTALIARAPELLADNERLRAALEGLAEHVKAHDEDYDINKYWLAARAALVRS